MELRIVTSVLLNHFRDLHNPHLHVLAADGAFLADGRFAALPPVPGTLLAGGFRRAVLEFLVKKESFHASRRRPAADLSPVPTSPDLPHGKNASGQPGCGRELASL